MDTKSLHFSLAIHLPTAKTLYCEIGIIQVSQWLNSKQIA